MSGIQVKVKLKPEGSQQKLELEEHVILRVPQQVASKIHQFIQNQDSSSTQDVSDVQLHFDTGNNT